MFYNWFHVRCAQVVTKANKVKFLSSVTLIVVSFRPSLNAKLYL